MPRSIELTRNVASKQHPLHPTFEAWCRKTGRPVNRQSGIEYARQYAHLIDRYATPRKG